MCTEGLGRDMLLDRLQYSKAWPCREKKPTMELGEKHVSRKSRKRRLLQKRVLPTVTNSIKRSNMQGLRVNTGIKQQGGLW